MAHVLVYLISYALEQHNKMLDLNEKEKHKSLIDTWSKVLSNYNTKNNLSTARQLAYSNNIPQEVRSNVWFIVSGARDLMNANCNIYDDLIEKQPNTKCMKQIEKDYCRSLGSKNMNIKYKHRLRRILIAYSNYNPSVTYTQGMNFIATFALKQYFEQAPQITIIDDINEETKLENDIINEYWLDCIEEQAFWTFTAIMKKITSLFDDGLVGFHQSVQCFEKLVKHYAPKDLVRHLNTENVYATVCTKWYLTLFTHPGMNENMVKRVWDIFIVEQFDFSV
eukprot:514661_1